MWGGAEPHPRQSSYRMRCHGGIEVDANGTGPEKAWRARKKAACWHYRNNFTHFQTSRKMCMCTGFQSRMRFVAPKDAILDGLFQQARCHTPFGAPRMAFWLGSRCWYMALRNTGEPMQSSKSTHGSYRSWFTALASVAQLGTASALLFWSCRAAGASWFCCSTCMQLLSC